MKNDAFFTVAGRGETTLFVQRSRFICQANHAPTQESAIQFIQQIKRKYHDATHNCYAYIIDSSQQKSSDDGEPAGTAGKPILEVLHHHKLLETVVVITRYFGGIKLGTGGLVRAYGAAANQAIEAAKITQKKLHQEIICLVDFTLWGGLEHYIRSLDYPMEQPIFTDQVQWSLWIPMDHVSTFIKQIDNWGQGKVKIKQGTTQYLVT